MSDIRREIDRIDGQLVKLLAERLALVENAIAVKRRDGITARVPERIDEVIANVRNLARIHKVDPAMAEAMWTEMVEWFVAYEERSLTKDNQV
ncbi:MAG: chorismate mutase [Methylocella sp.]